MISSVKLSNFLAFQRVEVEFGALTLLSGANSAGKSSVLHALAVLRQSHDSEMLPRDLLLNGDLVKLGVGRDVYHANATELSPRSEPAIEIVVRSDGGDQSWTGLYQREADTLRVGAHSGSPEDSGLFGPAFQFLTADRIVPSVTFPKSHEAVSIQRTLGARGEHTPNFLRIHGEEPISHETLIYPGSVGQSLIEQTNSWLGDLAVDTSLEVADVEATDFVRLVFRRAGEDVKTVAQRSTNVGFGLTYALPIIVGCLAAPAGSLLLVENPEAHLHPRGQALVGHLCALAAGQGAQVVIESHSDHVLNAIRLAVKNQRIPSSSVALNYFSREKSNLQPVYASMSVDEEGMIEAWPDGFFDQMDRALDELLD